jgi:protein phosphatase
MTTITIPELALLLLVGPSGAGKSTFARRHFRPTEVLASDFFRGLISDDEANQEVSGDAFEVLHLVAAKRLAGARLTVIDATNLQPEARKPLLEIARRHHCAIVAVVFDLPEEVCLQRNQQRGERIVLERVLRAQWQQLRRARSELGREGVRHVHVLASPEEVDTAVVVRLPLACNRREDHGPFDVIGDVHGCYDELAELLTRLGYALSEQPDAAGTPRPGVRPPPGRKAVFVGDLVDRGPKVPAVLRLVMGMVEAGTALCVVGNHDDKLLRKLQGRAVKVSHGLAETLAQIDREPPEFRDRLRNFLDNLVSHYVLDGGKLVVAHAGLKAALQGRMAKRVRDFALYGETTGETDEFGLPVRQNWAAEYRGQATVVYGHTPGPGPEWLNRTINIDTGCVFGGKLTALRYPEMELVSVPAARTYCPPNRPFLGQDSPASAPAPQASLEASEDHPPHSSEGGQHETGSVSSGNRPVGDDPPC